MSTLQEFKTAASGIIDQYRIHELSWDEGKVQLHLELDQLTQEHALGDIPDEVLDAEFAKFAELYRMGYCNGDLTEADYEGCIRELGASIYMKNEVKERQKVEVQLEILKPLDDSDVDSFDADEFLGFLDQNNPS